MANLTLRAAKGSALTHAEVDGNFTALNAERVATIAEMTAIAAPSTGMSVEVTDGLRGGMFVYDAARVAENDSGTVFDGWVRQYVGPVYVTWFGADPTGATDSTAAFNLATRANYVSTGNFDLNFPQAVATGPGQFRITGTVWVHKGQHLYGAGEGATRILLDTATAHTGPIFALGYNSIGEFVTSDAGGLPPEISGMWTYGGPSAHAVVFTGVAGASIHGMFLTSAGVGIEVFGTDTRVINCQLDGGLNAIKVGGHTHVFSNILIFNMNYGIITRSGAGGGCSEIVFDNVHCNYVPYVSVQLTASIDHRNLNFIGCNFVLNVQYETFQSFILTACNAARGITFNGCAFNNMRGPAYSHTNGIDNEIYFNDCLFSGTMTATDYVQSTTAYAAVIFNERVWFNDCQFVRLFDEPLILNGGSAETRVYVQGGAFRLSTATAFATIGATAPTVGASLTVYGMDFGRMNVPVVVESAMTEAWRIGSDQAVPMTGQGATASDVLPFGHKSVYLVDTTTAASTISLPRNDENFDPNVGDQLEFIDALGTWQTHNVTFVRGDNTINGAAANYVANQQNGRVRFIYQAGGWRATGGVV